MPDILLSPSRMFKGLSQPFSSLTGMEIGRSRWKLTRGLQQARRKTGSNLGFCVFVLFLHAFDAGLSELLVFAFCKFSAAPWWTGDIHAFSAQFQPGMEAIAGQAQCPVPVITWLPQVLTPWGCFHKCLPWHVSTVSLE